MSKSKQFFKKIEKSTKESEIEIAYSKLLDLDLDKFGSTDGVCNEFIFEFKYEVELRNSINKILAQLLNYVKKIQIGKIELDNDQVINYGFIADKDEVALVRLKFLKNFLNDNKYNWDLPPSNPDGQLVEDLKNVSNEAYKLFELKSKEDIEDFIYSYNTLKETGDDEFKIEITEHNYKNVYNKWYDRFGKDIKQFIKNKRNSIHFFLLDIIGNSTVSYDWGTLLFQWIDYKGESKTDQIKINLYDYENFWKIYRKPVNYSVYKIISNDKDEIIQPKPRREKGEYFTPIPLVKNELDKAKRIWNTDFSDYKIWDMAAGTGNLIKPFDFETYENVYISTYYKDDISEMNTNNIFPGATKFVYDFLNQTDDDLPENLIENLKNTENKWLFILNPPYKGKGSGSGKTHLYNLPKDTRIYKQMKNDIKINDLSCHDLQYQFYYRICNLKSDFNLNLKLILVHPFHNLIGRISYKDIKKYIFQHFKVFSIYNSYPGTGLFQEKSDWTVNVTMWQTK